MRSILTTATVLIVIATPVLAQSFDPDVGTGNIAPPVVANQVGEGAFARGGEGAYAQAPAGYETRNAHPQVLRRVHRPAHYNPMRTLIDNSDD